MGSGTGEPSSFPEGGLRAFADMLAQSSEPVYLTDAEGAVLMRLEPAEVGSVLPTAARGPVPGEEPDDVETQEGWVRRVRANLPHGSSVISVPINDLVERSRALLKDKETLEYQATHDALTDLPNRRAMADHLSWLETADNMLDVAVLHIDLDKFKAVNDTFGHDAGDVVIRDAGDRLRSILRDSDMVARVGGDEFVAICHQVKSIEQVERIADRIVQKMREPIPYGEEQCNIGASVGIALCQTKSEIRQSLTDADVALYEAKRAGRGCYRIYKPLYRQKQTALQLRVNAVREALDMNAFDPYFQPQVCARTGALVGVEALARWIERERGILSPIEFMDALEEAKLTEELDAMILRKSLKALATWDEMGLDVPLVSVNVSAARLACPDAVDLFKWALESAGLEPARLGIEILENVFIDDRAGAVARNVRRLSDAGFQIALDDFGTGHASIAGLRSLALDRIKIDRSFVSGLANDRNLQTIVGAMISLGKNLGMEVLSEGVEDDADLDVLCELGCDVIQGYRVARAMDQDRFATWLESRTGQPAFVRDAA